MAFTQSDLNYYIKNPSHITADLDKNLLLELIDYDAENIKYINPQTFELIQAAYEKDPAVFKYVDFSKVSIQFVEKVISTNPLMIQHLYSPSPEIIKLALSKDLNVLPFVEKYLDTKMYEWLLAQNGLILEFIQPGKQTEKMVIIALNENINSYQYADVKTKVTDILLIEKDPSKVEWLSNYWPELIEPLVKYNPRFITKFYNRPELLTKDIIKLAIKGEPQLYRTIPNPDFDIMKYTIDLDISMIEYMPYSQKLIDYAILKNGLALKYVKKKDLRTIKQAITQNVKALDFIPYPRQYLIDYAFKLDGYALKYIHNPSYEQCMDAVKRNPYAIEFVPANYRNKEMQLYALMGGPKVIPYIGTPADEEVILQILRIEPSFIFQIENPTDQMFVTSFSVEGRLMMFYYNWNTRFSNEIIGAALKQDGTIFEFVESKNKLLALIAISQWAPAVQWTKGFQDLELAWAAVTKDPRTIFFIDKNILDAALLNLALSLDPVYFTRKEGEMSFEEWLKATNNSYQ